MDMHGNACWCAVDIWELWAYVTFKQAGEVDFHAVVVNSSIFVPTPKSRCLAFTFVFALIMKDQWKPCCEGQCLWQTAAWACLIEVRFIRASSEAHTRCTFDVSFEKNTRLVIVMTSPAALGRHWLKSLFWLRSSDSVTLPFLEQVTVIFVAPTGADKQASLPVLITSCKRDTRA